MSEESEELSAEHVNKNDIFHQEQVEDVEGRITDFFLGLFGKKMNDDVINEEEDEAEGGDDEEFENDSNHKHPYARNSKLYGQDFEQLKADNISSGELFQDKRFPPVQASLAFSSPEMNIEWLRPHQLCEDPQLFVDGANRFDVIQVCCHLLEYRNISNHVDQGELGDCWLLAAMSSLAMDHSILHQVIPAGQGFGAEYQYVGMFRFRWVLCLPAIWLFFMVAGYGNMGSGLRLLLMIFFLVLVESWLTFIQSQRMSSGPHS